MQNKITLSSLILAALLLPSILFVSSPFSAIAANSAIIEFVKDDLKWTAIAFIVASLIILCSLVSVKQHVRYMILTLLTCITINIVIWNTLFSYIWISNIWKLAVTLAIECVVFFLVFFLIRKVPYALLLRSVAILSVLNMTVTAFQINRTLNSLPWKTHALKQTIGAQYVKNGTFDSGIEGWIDRSQPGGKISWNSPGHLNIISSGPEGRGWIGQNIQTIKGKEYVFSIEKKKGKFLQVQISGEGLIASKYPLPKGFYQIKFVASGNSTNIAINNYGFDTVVIDNISVRPIANNKAPGNVYHIVLDAFSKDYLHYSLNRKLPPNLDGFTFYNNATANYGRTNLSMRSVFLGSLYSENTVPELQGAFKNGFTKDLSANNIQQFFFPFQGEYCEGQVAVCRPTTHLLRHYRKDIGAPFTMDIAFLKMLPISLRSIALSSLGTESRDKMTWDYGFSLTSWWRMIMKPNVGVPMWRRPVQSLTINTFEEFKSMEPSESKTGRYVYIHMMIPHAPYVFNSQCEFVSAKRAVNSQQVDAQYACSLTIVQRIVNLLKELNRFDNSLIIVHSDHGYGNPSTLARWNRDYKYNPTIKNISRPDDSSDDLPSQQIDAIANVLLLIKSPEQATFEISNKRLQLIDVAPTILDYFGIYHKSYQGISAISEVTLPEREVPFFATNTGVLSEVSHFSKYLNVDNVWTFEARLPLSKLANTKN